MHRGPQLHCALRSPLLGTPKRGRQKMHGPGPAIWGREQPDQNQRPLAAALHVLQLCRSAAQDWANSVGSGTLRCLPPALFCPTDAQGGGSLEMALPRVCIANCEATPCKSLYQVPWAAASALLNPTATLGGSCEVGRGPAMQLLGSQHPTLLQCTCSPSYSRSKLLPPRAAY